MLSENGFNKAKGYIFLNGRQLEKIRYQNYFDSSSASFPMALKLYQNKDGGFGNGLEPDFRLPMSSAMATSIALRMLAPFEMDQVAEQLISDAIEYLENTFIHSIMGWEDVPKMVNLYPHAPWWHREGAIDFISGNPSAEIVGYLSRYRRFVKTLDVDDLIRFYMNRLEHMDSLETHEIYCYFRLYNNLSDVLKSELKPFLVRYYQSLVCNESWKWLEYVPTPYHFHTIVDDDMLIDFHQSFIENLLYLSEVLESEGKIEPNWTWGINDKSWDVAKREWTGILTLDLLIVLSKHPKLK